MSASIMGTLAVAQILRKRGFTVDQAIGVAEAFRENNACSLSTKADIRDVEVKIHSRIDRVETRLEAKIEASVAKLKVKILRWRVVTQIALAGFSFAAIKFAN